MQRPPRARRGARRIRRVARRIRRLGLIVLLLSVAAGPQAATAQTGQAAARTESTRTGQPYDADDSPGSANPVLQVPFVGQTELMCGAAAVVMTLRYWGDDETLVSHFAPLVRVAEGGIRTVELARSARDLGWEVRSFGGDMTALRHHLARGRPVIALIEVGAGRFHYVTVVGWLDGRLVFHDPAISPYQWMEQDDFDRAWQTSGRWAMLVLPTSRREAWPGAHTNGLFDMPAVAPQTPAYATERPPIAASRDSSAAALDSSALRRRPLCSELIRRAGADARASRLGRADDSLGRAAELCPGDARIIRELAALRLRQGRPEEAARTARRAVALDPTDHLSLELLAAAHYLAGDEIAALAVWHRTGSARLGDIELAARTRTRHSAILRLSGLEQGGSLAPDALALSRRRMEMLPVAIASRVDYRPRSDGRVDAEIGITERPTLPLSTPDLVRQGISAAVDQEIELHAGSLLRAGELWTLGWRWERSRRALTIGLDIPGGLFKPGIWSLRGKVQRESYAFSPVGVSTRIEPDANGAVGMEERRRASLGFALWTSPSLRWLGTLAFDHWEEGGSWGSIGLAARVEDPRRGWAAMLGGEVWWSPAGRSGFARGDIGAAWRSSPEREDVVLHARGGASWVTSKAPGSVWPGAGTGSGRQVLSRAHPLLSEGVVSGPLFGRGLVHAGLEAAWWTARVGPASIAPAIFLDMAYASARPEALAHTTALQADAGIGLRVGFPGGAVLRVDFARGLRDGASAWSISLFRGAAPDRRR